MKKTVALVVGTRPEVIKMAPLWFALKASTKLQPLLISTGQHREMLDQAFAVFGLRPDRDLALMQPGQTLPELTARVLTSMAATLRAERPAAVSVQGDTTTVLGTALAAFYERIPVGHVEAGLRTHNFDAPWPEEMNRRLADPISRWCFAPTEWSAANLLAERVPADAVHVTGNTVVDSLLWVRAKSRGNGVAVSEFARRCGIPDAFRSTFLEQTDRRFVLITGHRRESFGQGFEQICQAIAELALRHPDLGLLYPVHLNPQVQEPVRRILGGNPRVALIPPVGYEDFICLMDRCHFVLSDSGGVQEEAPSLGKPVLVMRETTERPEGVTAGTCRLVGTSAERIIAEADNLLSNPEEYASRSALKNPYGDGTAARRITAILERDLI
jgi:UDP-N-acetylglucosamine 2-epimerase (non-hydrolysing)